MNRLEEYATLLVEVGLNVKKGDTVVIQTQVEDPRLARLVAKHSYKKGAREVVVKYNDDVIDRMKYLYAFDEVFTTFPNWIVEYFDYYDKHSTCYLHIVSSDPESLKGVDTNKITSVSRLANKALKKHIEMTMGNELSWCVAAIPGIKWAKKVFPNESDSNALEKLWDVIFDIVRVGDGNAVEKWKNHTATMSKRNTFMNNANFKTLNFKSGNGTNLSVGLVKNHIWCGGSEYNARTNVEFVANIPTEECFTMPDCNNVNGVVYSTKPLSVHGNIVDEFMFEFKDGKIINFDAKVGLDVLETLLKTDEGSLRIGEVALVPYDSPISNTNILFYETLFDENASCHLALGKAYSINIKNYERYSKEQLKELGVNDSVIHVDFMIGAADTEITGETQDGKFVDVFRDGNFVI